MKKVCRTIKLLKFKNEVNDCKNIEGKDFLVCFKSGKYKEVYCKSDLIKLLEKDHINPIWYIFDMTDRILVRRDVLIQTDEA